MSFFRTRSLGLFTALLTAFAAVWCCCVPPANASAMRHSCCDAVEAGVERDTPSHCPVDRTPADGCPLIKLRQSMELPTPAITPTPIDLATPLQAWLLAPALLPTAAVFTPVVRPVLSTGPPTLLNLHASLLW